MKTKVLVLLLFTAGLLVPARAQDRGAGTDPLAAGIRQLEGGDLEGAVQTLGTAVRQLATDKQRSKDLALTHVYLATAHLGLDDPAAAKKSMVDALSVDRDLKLDAKRFPPRVRQLQEEVKVEMKQGTRTASAPAGSVRAAAPTQPPAPVTPPPATYAPPRAVGSPARPAIPVSVGARVRVAAPATGNKTVVGTLVRSDGDTIVVERESTREGLSIPAGSLTRLDVSRGRSSKAITFGLGGLLVGGAGGAAYGSRCTYDPFGDPCFEKKGVGKWAAVGGAGGLVIGGLIGKMSGKEHWEAVSPRQVWIAPLGFRGVQITVGF